MTHRNINKAGLELIKSYESFVGYVYDDQKVIKGVYPEWTGWKPRGVLTIGYGHTNDAQHPLKIRKGLRITEPEALEILDVDLDECEDAVSRAVKVDLNDNQFAALVSFHFNTGKIFAASFVRELNKGNYAAVRPGLMAYTKATNKDTGKLETLRGLVRRRQAEVDLFYKAVNSRTKPLKPLPVKTETELLPTVIPEPPPEDQSLTQSGVMRGAAVAATGSAAQVTDKTVDIVDTLSQTDSYVSAGTWLGLTIGLIILGSALYVMYSRAKAANKLPTWLPKFLR